MQETGTRAFSDHHAVQARSFDPITCHILCHVDAGDGWLVTGLGALGVHDNWASGAKQSLEGIIDGAHALRGNMFHPNRMGYKGIGTIAACTLHGGPSGAHSAAPHVGFARVTVRNDLKSKSDNSDMRWSSVAWLLSAAVKPHVVHRVSWFILH